MIFLPAISAGPKAVPLRSALPIAAAGPVADRITPTLISAAKLGAANNCTTTHTPSTDRSMTVSSTSAARAGSLNFIAFDSSLAKAGGSRVAVSSSCPAGGQEARDWPQPGASAGRTLGATALNEGRCLGKEIAP